MNENEKKDFEEFTKKISAREFVDFHKASKRFIDKEIVMRDDIWNLRFYVLSQTQNNKAYDNATKTANKDWEDIIGTNAKKTVDAGWLIDGFRAKLNLLYACNLIAMSVYDPETDKPLFPSVNNVLDMMPDEVARLHDMQALVQSEYCCKTLNVSTKENMDKWIEWIQDGITPEFFFVAATERVVFVDFLKYLVSMLPNKQQNNTLSIDQSIPTKIE